ncbi:MAG: hypothetical protein AABX33_05780 [Nanoarchaeota archaeon]
MTYTNFQSFSVTSKSCEVWHSELEQAFSVANYCTRDSDCQVLELENYAEFACFKLVNNMTENALYAELEAYHTQCNQEPIMLRECAPAPKSVCESNKCVFLKGAFDNKPVDEKTRIQTCIEGCGVGYCGNKTGCSVPGYLECTQICRR